jgi:hypothetical protein
MDLRKIGNEKEVWQMELAQDRVQWRRWRVEYSDCAFSVGRCMILWKRNFHLGDLVGSIQMRYREAVFPRLSQYHKNFL